MLRVMQYKPIPGKNESHYLSIYMYYPNGYHMHHIGAS